MLNALLQKYDWSSRAPKKKSDRRGLSYSISKTSDYAIREILICGISLNKGFHAVRTYLGSINGPRFIQWLKNVLLPTMEPGQTLVLDNLRVHHIAEVREHVESINCHLLYLPPYSPDMNPIELAWSKLKNYLRKRSERLTPQVRRAVVWGAATISQMDVAGWFNHAGWA